MPLRALSACSSSPSSGGTSATIRPGHARAGGVGAEARDAVALDDRGVRHRDQRARRAPIRARVAAMRLEAARRRHARGQGGLGRALDRRPVGERIGEGDADLDRGRARLDGRGGGVGQAVAGHQVDRERGRAQLHAPLRASTVSMSLSPRPERQTITIGVRPELAREPLGGVERVGRLERGDDALGAAQAVERLERLVVAHAHVLGAPAVGEQRVLGADAGVVEPGRDRVALGDLAPLVAQHVASASRAAPRRGRRRSRRRAGRRRRRPPRRRPGARRRRGTRGTCRSRSSRRRRRPRRRRAAAPPARASARAPRGRSPTAARARAWGRGAGRRPSRSGSASSRRSRSSRGWPRSWPP